MNNLLQYTIVGLIVGLALAWAVRWIYQAFTRKRPSCCAQAGDSCSDCQGVNILPGSASPDHEEEGLLKDPPSVADAQAQEIGPGPPKP